MEARQAKELIEAIQSFEGQLDDLNVNLGSDPVRRERIATAAMQGMLASYSGETEFPKAEFLIKQAVMYADALIKKLDE